MSHVNRPINRAASSPTRRFAALPVWLSMAIVVAALVTGAVVAFSGGEIGRTFLVAFALGSVAATGLVELSGLFLTVAVLPFFFGAATLLTSFSLVLASNASTGGTLSRTQVVTAVYPLLELFPPLFLVTVFCVFVAALRLVTGKRRAANIDKNAYASRQSTSAAERRNRESNSRARQTARHLTVAELVERNKQQSYSRRSNARMRTRARVERFSQTPTSSAAQQARRVQEDARKIQAIQPPRHSSDQRAEWENTGNKAVPPRISPDPNRRAGDTRSYRPRRRINYSSRNRIPDTEKSQRDGYTPKTPPSARPLPKTKPSDSIKPSNSDKPSNVFDKDLYSD